MTFFLRIDVFEHELSVGVFYEAEYFTGTFIILHELCRFNPAETSWQPTSKSFR